MRTLLLWFDNIPQAQDWQLKLKDFNPSDIAARSGKKYTIEIEVEWLWRIPLNY